MEHTCWLRKAVGKCLDSLRPWASEVQLESALLVPTNDSPTHVVKILFSTAGVSLCLFVVEYDHAWAL